MVFPFLADDIIKDSKKSPEINLWLTVIARAIYEIETGLIEVTREIDRYKRGGKSQWKCLEGEKDINVYAYPVITGNDKFFSAFLYIFGDKEYDNNPEFSIVTHLDHCFEDGAKRIHLHIKRLAKRIIKKNPIVFHFCKEYNLDFTEK